MLLVVVPCPTCVDKKKRTELFPRSRWSNFNLNSTEIPAPSTLPPPLTITNTAESCNATAQRCNALCAEEARHKNEIERQTNREQRDERKKSWRYYLSMQTTLPSSSLPSDGGDQFLLPTLRQILPALVSYLVVDTIVQANAVGYILGLHYNQNEDVNNDTAASANATANNEDHQLCRPSKVFVKHVDATLYAQTKQNWNDLRRTLMYARTEKRFYRDFAPRLRAFGFDAIPRHLLAVYQFGDWVSEEERATAASDPSMTLDRLVPRRHKPANRRSVGCWYWNTLIPPQPTFRILRSPSPRPSSV